MSPLIEASPGVRPDRFLPATGFAQRAVSASELRVREARPEEVARVVELVNDAYGRTETPSGWTSEDDILEGPRVEASEVRGILESPEGTMLVAGLEGDLVGCVHVQRLEEGASEIGMLSVRPDLQDRGLGRGVLAAAEEHARAEHEAPRAVLHVLTVREELIEWYQRRGYELTGATKPFEPEDPQRSMVGPLAFAVLDKRLGCRTHFA